MTNDRTIEQKSIPDRIERWRAAAHHYGLDARSAWFDDGDYERAAAASSMAAMYFAMALDAHHFGRMPKPEVRPNPDPTPVRLGPG